MTAAFAKELGLQVRYQSAYITEAWRRKGDLLLLNGHVNVTLGQPSKLTAARRAREWTGFATRQPSTSFPRKNCTGCAPSRFRSRSSSPCT